MTSPQQHAGYNGLPGASLLSTLSSSFLRTLKPLAGIGLGLANQLLGMNAAGTANEYKTLNGTANRVSVAHAPGLVTLSTPQDTHAGATPTFAGLNVTPGGISSAGDVVSTAGNVRSNVGNVESGNNVTATNIVQGNQVVAVTRADIATTRLHEVGGVLRLRDAADTVFKQLQGASPASADAFVPQGFAGLIEAIVRKLRETGGPTDLTMAGVADGQGLKRNGATIDGFTINAGTVTAVTGSNGIQSSGGATPNISPASGFGVLRFINISIDDAEVTIAAGGAAGASTPLPPATVVVPARPNRQAIIVLAQSEVSALINAGQANTRAEVTLTIGGGAVTGRQPRIEGGSDIGEESYPTMMTVHVKTTGADGANDVAWANLVRDSNNGEINSRRRVLHVFEVLGTP